ncbi:hypothetical protein F5148DRAFT_1287217 [Russula earlei]|uniref:Uncharacterized protein n=1 Tax=Russula earlei TaxID=71964 RepID=A0ACC0U2D3_9AGAM|nr:hypothetical protein F5148DRAFT_1287217 [Russula earlei]
MSRLAIVAAAAVGYALYNLFFGSGGDDPKRGHNAAPPPYTSSPPIPTSSRSRTSARTPADPDPHRDFYRSAHRQHPPELAAEAAAKAKAKSRTLDRDPSAHRSSHAPPHTGRSRPAAAAAATATYTYPAAHASHSYSYHDEGTLSALDGENVREKATVRYRMMMESRDLAKSARERMDVAAERRHNRDALVHESEMKRLNGVAAQLIFAEKNRDRPEGTVDLHGLYVDEAVEHAKREIRSAALRRPNNVLHFIVGKGLHTKDGKAKIRPAVEQLCERRHLTHYLDPRNAGVLIVHC